MTNVSPVGQGSLSEIPELRQAARALEGVFLQQMLQAMRATVPENGLFEASPARDVYTEMFDQHVAETMAQRSSGGLGDAVYDQLRRRIHEIMQSAEG